MIHQVSRRVCVRDFNLAETVLCANTGNSHGTEYFTSMVGSESDTDIYIEFCGVIHTVIFTHFFFYSKSGKNSNFEASKQVKIDSSRLSDHFDFVFGSEFDFAGWMES